MELSEIIMLLLVFLPMSAGLFAFFIRSNICLRLLVISIAILHLALVIIYWNISRSALSNQWFYLDSLGAFFLTITSLLFFASAIYGLSYLKTTKTSKESFFSPNAVFVGCLLIFLATMTVITLAQHLGILWIAMEATTLITTPLICYHRNQRSLEAAWKYLLICSVGIGLALLGNMFLVVANPQSDVPFLVVQWIKNGPMLNQLWIKAAFIFFFVGYGTKMGLTPFHTWLPDAHSEAPSMVSALLSGTLLNCAFLGLLRIYPICCAAGLIDFVQDIFLFFGVLTILFAAVCLIEQTDFKRMLAYSSIENMGILALGMGLGGNAIFAALFHALNHSFIKSSLFLTSGNILSCYQTKTINEISNLSRRLPWSGSLWISGFFAIIGMPPFATFISKLLILKAAFKQGHEYIAALILLLLTVIFIGMANIFLSMFQKRNSDALQTKESWNTVVIPTLFIGMILILGFIPIPFIGNLLNELTKVVKGNL